MALTGITFIKSEGGLGRRLTSQDHISGFLIYDSTLPSGFSSGDRIKIVNSLPEAEALGIVDTLSDATAATGGGFTVTAVGADGDKITVTYTEPLSTVTLGTYTKVSTDTTVTNVAAAIVAAINANTGDTGYSASNTAGAVTITAPKRLGVFPNSTTVVTTITGTMTVGSATNFSSGVGSKLAVYHYHISEYFRKQPQGELYIGVYAVPGTYTFSEITTMQNYALGKIVQMSIWVDRATAFASGHTTTIQAVLDALDADEKPISAVGYFADITGTANISGLSDLSSLSNEKVSCPIGQDGRASGYLLYKATGKSVGHAGLWLGDVSLAKVSDNIAWRAKFNASNGSENEVIAFANGQLYTDLATSALVTAQNKRYIFLMKQSNYSGSFWNADNTVIVSTSDYSKTRNNRTIDKAIKSVRTVMAPLVSSPIQLNADGTLSGDVIDYFKATAESGLDGMLSANELSAYSVSIDASQDVLATGEIELQVNIVPIGSAEFITIYIGFVTSI